MSKRWIWEGVSMSRSPLTAGVILVLTLAALGYHGYQNYLAPVPATPTKSEAFVTAPNTPEVVTAEGKIVPANDATLAFRLSARVAEILVQEGDTVEAGQTLIQLEKADDQIIDNKIRGWIEEQSRFKVIAANEAVAAAQAALDQVLAGAGEETI